MVATLDPIRFGPCAVLSNGNLTLTETAMVNSQRWLSVAVDFGAKKIWVYNPNNALWNAGTIAAQNPATGVGTIGYTFTGTPTLFIAFSGQTASGASDAATLNTGASGFKYPVPSGFSSWDSLAGSATAWDASKKDASITLTGGNLTATSTASGAWRSALSTNGLSSGKAYFEIAMSAYDNGNGFMFGLGTASMATNNYCGSTAATGAGWQVQSSSYGAASGTIGFYNSWAINWGSDLSTTGYSSGKYYFEVTASNLGANSEGLVLGVGNALMNTFQNVGFDANSTAWQPNNPLPIGALVTQSDSVTAGDVLGVAVDVGAAKIWFYAPSTGHWNSAVIGSQNPATGTGGFSTSGIGTPLYAAIGVYAEATSAATINFGASAFAHTPPTGFSSWAGSPPVDLAGNLGAPSHYGKTHYGLGHYSRISAFAPLFAGDLSIVPVVNFSGGFAPTIVLAADLDVHVNLIDLAAISPLRSRWEAR